MSTEHYIKNDNYIEEVTTQLSSSLVQQKEQLIRDAIAFAIGASDWLESDIVGRGVFKVLPDTTEVFNFDGVDLIHFMNPRVEYVAGTLSTSVKLVQNYKLLYTLR